MGRNNRHGRNRHSSWSNQNNQGIQNNASREKQKSREPVFQRTVHEDYAEQQKKDEAIRALKAREVICPVCGKPIEDMTNAMTDKASGKPAHFDCILDQLSKSETVGENDRITYIGQGRFAVLHFDNPRDMKTFKIVKTIEWESRDAKPEWRDEMSGLFSQIL